MEEFNDLLAEDTIVAISTPLGTGGIGIVRLSGNDAFAIVNKIFHPRNRQEGFPKSHRIYYGELMDSKGAALDEVLVNFMKAPGTYTREDVVEINCHSGLMVLQMVLKEVVNNGARLAEAGEFTKRAFFNGRIDLAQAEGIINLINARSEKGVKNALKHLKGGLSERLRELSRVMTDVIASIEASVDFPGEAEEVNTLLLERDLKIIEESLKELYESSEKGDIFQSGLKVAIVGRPNVGKSSLLNALLSRERAIVTNVPGTTRDLIEEQVIIEGVPVRLTDTAGIRNTANMVEEKGVSLSLDALRDSDLVLFMLDGSQELQSEDRKIFSIIREEGKDFILLVNKCDLNTVINFGEFSREEHKLNLIRMSVLNETGLNALQKEILNKVARGDVIGEEGLMITGMRQKKLISQAINIINESLNNLGKVPIDLISADLKSALKNIGDLTGDGAGGDILNTVFLNFCLGK